MKILLIEDNADLGHLTKTALTHHGYQVALSQDAEDGIQFAKHFKPQLILMDVMLPGMSGAEALRVLKGDPALKDIPVVFLTGLIAGEETALEGEGINVDGVQYPTLGKPYEVEKLLETVQSALK